MAVSIFKLTPITGASLSSSDVSEESLHLKAITIIELLASSFFYATQLMIFKQVLKTCPEPFKIAFSFLFFAACLGVLNMLYLIVYNPEDLGHQSFVENFTAILTGILTAIGIVTINVSCSYGFIGISNAVMHCCTIFITVFNYLVFK